MIEATRFDVTATSDRRETRLMLNFPASCPVSAAGARARQLHAALLAISGTGFEVFQTMDNGAQSELLWLACGMANEIATLCEVAE